MPFQTVPCNSGYCQFSNQQCKKGCVSAIPHPDNPDWWLCKWVQTLEKLNKVLDIIANPPIINVEAFAPLPSPLQDYVEKRTADVAADAIGKAIDIPSFEPITTPEVKPSKSQEEFIDTKFLSPGLNRGELVTVKKKR